MDGGNIFNHRRAQRREGAVGRCLTHGWVAVEERFNVEFRGIKHADDDSVARCECGRVIS
jgi:hypothetical protein